MGDIDELARDLHTFAEALQNQETLNKIGLAAIRRIKKRTRKGIGVSGEAFRTPSAETYGAYSESHGERRAAEGLPTDRINLEFSLYDGMLTKLTYDVSRDLDEVTLYFDDEEKSRIASYITEEGIGTSGHTYEFYGLNESDEEAIAELVGRQLEEALQLADLT